MFSCDYAELFISYPGHPYLAVVDGVREDGQLNRIFLGSSLYDRRVGMGEKQQYEVHQVPLIDAVYEIGENIGSRRTQRYVATREGDPLLYPLRRDQVEAIAEGTTTIDKLVAAKLAEVRPSASQPPTRLE